MAGNHSHRDQRAPITATFQPCVAPALAGSLLPQRPSLCTFFIVYCIIVTDRQLALQYPCPGYCGSLARSLLVALCIGLLRLGWLARPGGGSLTVAPDGVPYLHYLCAFSNGQQLCCSPQRCLVAAITFQLIVAPKHYDPHRRRLALCIVLTGPHIVPAGQDSSVNPSSPSPPTLPPDLVTKPAHVALANVQLLVAAATCVLQPSDLPPAAFPFLLTFNITA